MINSSVRVAAYDRALADLSTEAFAGCVRIESAEARAANVLFATHHALRRAAVAAGAFDVRAAAAAARGRLRV
jgi:hypothetical protein